MKKVTIIIPAFEYKDVEKTVSCLEKQTHSTKVIVVDRPDLNVSEARNLGIKKAETKIVGFTDDDAYPHEDWVEKAIRNFESDRIAGVEGKTYGGLNRIYPWGFMGCNIFYRREILEDIGGFNEELAGWREDTDLAWRILDKGYEIKYEPRARVHHPSEPKSSPERKKDLLLFRRHPVRYIKNEIFRKPLYIMKEKFRRGDDK